MLNLSTRLLTLACDGFNYHKSFPTTNSLQVPVGERPRRRSFPSVNMPPNKCNECKLVVLGKPGVGKSGCKALCLNRHTEVMKRV
ncbi:hypothetical protein HOLleu_36544 [Holothuria leucospilota]|uniref:Uncharacterized protein n=1 Tax=Holothuria leucospilota TaxID=206669 RepID=A0A9Q1BFR3_HOLLE|nr:hypothetical protein HOLleu_36544 [Holothuria leucospilota]